ncbi:MAG: membrane protein insertion efficiency factor YidD [Dehalococcoidia bacterium]|nr:MAG: membrane protein insertion efficiency factor YidD [Dehalococcoidia bacterium]UCG82797.1 MAG: membrane protein insertion efficiency factor YidD [Dehalococcoidia bacterium]
MVKNLTLRMIKFYKVAISPNMPTSCRFVPSCSNYGYEAVEKYGVLKGCWLIARRLSRCHPLGKGGIDPVP